MKLNKLVMACGALFAAGTGTQAFAVDLYVSGASALQVSFQKAVAELCDPNPISPRAFFTNSNGQSYQCTSKAGVYATPQPLNIYKRNAGGSAFGVFPVASNSAAAPYNVVTFTSQSGCTASGTVVIGGLTWTNNTSCGNTGHIFPDAGVSDVEPALFGYKPGSGLVASSPIVAQVFGIPVSNKLYRQLQALQGINGNTVAMVTAADPNFLPTHAPSLTYAQVRSLFTGDYRDWTFVNPGITPAAVGSSTFVKVCRRVVSSGTQASINALLLNNPCGAGPFGGQLFAADNSNDDPATNDTAAMAGNYTAVSTLGDNYVAVMNSGAAQVDSCLTHADGNNQLAIGLLGTERLSGASPVDDDDVIADGWHYVKLSGGNQTQQPPVGDDDKTVQHGAYPSVDNTIASTYDLYAEATFNNRLLTTYSADKQVLLTKLPVLMGNPVTIVSDNLLGLAALWTNGYNPTNAAHYPTLKGTRFGNTCRPTTLQY